MLKDVFHDYKPVWSLADNKYAGTLTLMTGHTGAISCGDFDFTVEIRSLVQRFM